MNKTQLKRGNDLLVLISIYKEKLNNLNSKPDELLIGYKTGDGRQEYIGTIEDISYNIIGSNIPSVILKNSTALLKGISYLLLTNLKKN